MKKPSALTTALVRNLICLTIALGVAGGLYVELLIEQYTGHFLSNIEAKLVDLRFKLRKPRVPHAEVVIVAVDGKSIDELGRWPWSRSTHAGLVDRLREWGASTVVFDVLFTESQGASEAARLREIASALPDPEATGSEDSYARARTAVQTALDEALVDQAFAAALERTFDDDAGLAVLAFDFVYPDELDPTRHLGAVLDAEDEQIILDIASYMSRDENVAVMRRDPPRLAIGVGTVVTGIAEWAAALGHANPVFDKDGAVRRERIVVVYSPALREAFQTGADLGPALLDPAVRVQAYMPLAVAGVATHLRLAVNQVVLDLPAGELRLEADAEKGGERVHHFDPVDGTARIDYCGSAATFPTYSYVDVLRDQLVDPEGRALSGPDAFANKLVFVGYTEPGIGDLFLTPFTARLPGVEKHANAAENILSGRQLRTHRDPELVIGLTAVIAAVVVALVAGNVGTLLASVFLSVLTMTYLLTTYMDFVSNGMLWNWIVPVLTVVFSYAGVSGYRAATELRAKRAEAERSRFIQETFGRYLSEQVVARLVDSPDALALGGERRRLTIVMSDLRGFSALCERSSPDVVIGLLNNYLGSMTEVIFKHGGTIDEFIGDAILSLFGAPVSREDDARRAVACAVEMQLAMKSVNEHLQAQGFPAIEMGIALNTGEVIVGNIGSERRAKYGVVGSNVNLTARIESHTVGGQIYISQQTLEEAGDIVVTGARIEVRAKGFADPIPAYEVFGIGGPYDVHLEEAEERLQRLEAPIAIELTVLKGKEVTESAGMGELVRLSDLGADLRSPTELEHLNNVRMKVFEADGTPFEHDLYAKVVDRPADDGCYAIRFTSTPEEMKQYFASLRVEG